MADITSRDFQELIKRQQETTDKLGFIVDQNADAALDRDIEKNSFKMIGLERTEGDKQSNELQKDTIREIEKSRDLQEKDNKENTEKTSGLQQQIVEANKKGFLTFGERLKFLGLNLKETLTRSLEDRNDLKRMFSKIGGGLKDIGKSLLGKITSPVVDGFKSISAIAANILKGGAIIAAMFGIQKFINSDMFPKFLEGLEKFVDAIIDMSKATFNYIMDLYDIFMAEGGGVAGIKAVAMKLFEDTGEALGEFKKTFLIGIGVALAAFTAAVIFALSTATKMIRGVGGMLGFGRKGAGKTPKTPVKPDVRGTSKMDMSSKKQTIKPEKPSRMPGVKNVAKSGARVALGAAKFAGPVGLAVAGAQGVYDATQGFKNANELFGKETNNFEKIMAGGASALEGFTFGLLKAEDMIDTPGDKIERYAKQVEKSQLSFEKFEKFQEKRLQEGDITQEQFDKLIERKRVATVESMKKNNEQIKKVMDKNNDVLEKSSLRQIEKINELVELMKDNTKLVAEKENVTASFMMAGGSTNIQNNNSDKTVVMDTPIVDSFHSQVYRQSYG
tara:strand:- start:53 stop:1732 length:1680 start_codon:yes stop_codon:yes gene_type:complete